jgi:hypothetical protein
MGREKTQISKIRDEKGAITTHTKEIQGIIKMVTWKVFWAIFCYR